MKLATLCYVRENGRTLMIHRTKKRNDMHQGKWNGLGGKLEAGESPEECARREIQEESGLNVDRLTLKGVLTFPEFSKGEDWYAFIFEACGVSGEMIDSPEGVLEWVPDGQILELNLWEGDRIFIPWLSQEKFFSGKFIYRDGELRDYQVSFYG